MGRQHPETKGFRLVWYDHQTGQVGMKDLKGSRSRMEDQMHKKATELGLW